MQKGRKPLSAYPNIRWAKPPESKKSEDKPAEPVDPPDWLDPSARAIFAIKVAQIQAAGYWQELYEDSLALLASLLAEYRRNPAKMPSAKVTQMRLLLSELGLTPQSARGVTRIP